MSKLRQYRGKERAGSSAPKSSLIFKTWGASSVADSSVSSPLFLPDTVQKPQTSARQERAQWVLVSKLFPRENKVVPYF